MYLKNILPAIVVGVALVGLMSAPAAKAESEAAKIAKLIEQLGDDSFETRQAATEALDKIGKPALGALEKALTNADSEIRKRAKDLVGRISKRADSDAVLTPKMVHLVFKETPITDAVAELKKQTGYNIVLHDPEKKLAGKKVTVDTGKVAFWVALEKFCDAAGITEGDPNAGVGVGGPAIGGPIMPMPAPVPGVRPLPAVRPPARALPAVPPAKAEEKKAEEKPVGDEKKPEEKKPEAKADAEAKEAEAAAAEQRKLLEAKVAELRAKIAAAGPGAVAGGGVVIGGGRVMVGGGGFGVPPGGAVLPGGPGIAWTPVQPGQITLLPGKSTKRVTDATSAIRVRTADPKTHPFRGTDKEIGLMIEISVEPRITWQQLLSVQIDKALDENEQKLLASQPDMGKDDVRVIGGGIGGGGIMIRPAIARIGPGMWIPSTANGLHHYARVGLQKGEKETKTLKELSGTVNCQVLGAAEAVIAVDNLLKAEGKSAKGTKSGEITVNSVSKNEEGYVKVTFDISPPEGYMPQTMFPEVAMPKVEAPVGAGGPGAPPGIALVPAIGVPNGLFTMNGVVLQDAKGNILPGQMQLDFAKMKGGFAPGVRKLHYIATYKVPKDGAEPAKLAYMGRRQMSISVPFKLTNVDLK
jgi:hypothetical protein